MSFRLGTMQNGHTCEKRGGINQALKIPNFDTLFLYALLVLKYLRQEQGNVLEFFRQKADGKTRVNLF